MECIEPGYAERLEVNHDRRGRKEGNEPGC
jgi:hypothetical protein